MPSGVYKRTKKNMKNHKGSTGKHWKCSKEACENNSKSKLKYFETIPGYMRIY
jgi:hypothetical protein